jgi:predicted nucleic acid-binding protein
MSVAYVDSSCVVAIAFRERGAVATARRLEQFDQLVASNLLEAELRAAFARERTEFDPSVAAALSWIVPERPLSREIERVLETGYVRGADCWHLATALYVAENPDEITFLTLDAQQAAVAATLGFRS